MNNVFKATAYVGTYTNEESRGIYSFTLNLKEGIIEKLRVEAEVHNPTYLAVDKANRHLYSVIKIDESGGVAAFLIDEATGSLKLINYEVSEGKPPCYVSLDDKDEYLFSGNYHKGTVEVIPIGCKGELLKISSAAVHKGSGPSRERQENAHIHYAALASDKKHLCVVDLGMDKLAVYNIDKGIIEEAKELSIQLKPGCGPRHMDFHPSDRFAYIATELSSEIIVLDYSKLKCSFSEKQYISTIPRDYNGENMGSAVHVSPDGRYLYSSNRGHDSIAVFSIDEATGKLTYISYMTTHGVYPRDFAIDPTGNFMAVANQKSNNITLFKINRTTGALTPTGISVSVPEPVCIKFLNVK